MNFPDGLNKAIIGLAIIAGFIELVITLGSGETRVAIFGKGTSTHLATQSAVLSAEASVGIPVELVIPSLDINTPIESVGQDANGNMDVPKQPMDVAWYNLGFRPGQSGNAVIDGHVDSSTGAPLIFANLASLQAGDLIYVKDDAGKTRKFVVTHKQAYPNEQTPLSSIFGADKKAHLNLITCTGIWDRSQMQYTQRLVVYSDLVE